MSSIAISIFSLCFLGVLSLLLASSIPANFYKRAKCYFGSPLDGSFELDWTLRQFYRLFSVNASERWYEARSFCWRGVFVSTLCAVGLIHVVRITYIEEISNDLRCRSIISIYHTFRSESSFRSLIKKEIDSFNCEETTPMFFFDELLIAGRNVIYNP